MKIVEQNPSRLLLAEHPRFLAGLFALMILALGYMLFDQWDDMGTPERGLVVFLLMLFPVIMHFSVHWVDVRFSRAVGRIEIIRRGLFYNRTRSYRLDLFERARLDTNSSGDGGDTYRVVLIFDEAMVSEMPADLRDEIERQTRRGFRQTPPHEVPLTYYYSSTEPLDIIKSINGWAHHI